MDESSQGEPSDNPGMAARPQLVINYIKSTQFRVVHSDGVVGGPSPKADTIHASFFSERHPIPVQTVHELEDGRLTSEISKISREGVVREVEVDVVLSVDMAEEVANWLLDRVKETRGAMERFKESLRK